MKQPEEEMLGIHALFDIRPETLASTLLAYSEQLEAGAFTLEDVVISPQGSGRRMVTNEVAKIKKKLYAFSDVPALLIEINRKGLFDTLPAGLFLQAEETDESPIKRARTVARQTREARKFFLPFEQAIYQTCIEIDQLEQKLTQQFPDFIAQLWQLDQFADVLNDRQQFLLCYVLPEAYRIVGNWELTGHCFEAVLRKPVDIAFTPPATYENPNAKHPPLSERRLGDDTLLGSSFRDDIPALKISIRGINSTELSEYLEGGRQKKVLEELLYSYFLPLDIAVRTEIIVTGDAWENELGLAYLGFNSHFV